MQNEILEKIKNYFTDKDYSFLSEHDGEIASLALSPKGRRVTTICFVACPGNFVCEYLISNFNNTISQENYDVLTKGLLINNCPFEKVLPQKDKNGEITGFILSTYKNLNEETALKEAEAIFNYIESRSKSAEEKLINYIFHK